MTEQPQPGAPGPEPATAEGPRGASPGQGAPSAEAAARETEPRFRLLVEAMPQIVCVLAPDGTPEYVNPAWTAFSGLDLAATARAGWLECIHPDDLERVRACRRGALKTLEPQDVELRYRAADGSYRWFMSRLVPIVEAGRVLRLLGAGMDVDDRRRAENALRHGEERLRGALDAARVAEEAARDADRRKSEFLGVLSHELRNPLAPILNSIHLLERAPPGSAPAARAREVLRRQAEHLTRLVDDLLDVTRISRGRIVLQRGRLDLREVVRKATDDQRSVFAQAGVVLHVEHVLGPVWIDADATRLAQVLGNLLQNAVKFTARGGAVSVSIVAGGGAAEVRVRDDGEGMDPATVERMFDPFVQGDQTLARSKGGLGLGLALVKALVELHGGRVEARSEGPGRGSELVIRLPLAEDGAAPADTAPPAAPARARTILLVEDNPDAAQTLADILTIEGHRVHVAGDGRSAVALARELRPDVVLCDIGLPDLDGYEVARALRADPALASTRLVALSGYAQPEDRLRGREAGFDAHLAKPPDVDDLMRAIAAEH